MAETYKPKGIGERVKTRKELFEALNQFVCARNGWITSIPGDIDVTMECLCGSTLPAELKRLGYDVEEAGEGERIIPGRIVERFTRNGDGELVLLIAGSTRPIAETRRHAGICRVQRFSFGMP